MALLDQAKLLFDSGIALPYNFKAHLASAQDGCLHSTAQCIAILNNVEGERRTLGALKSTLRALMVGRAVGAKKLDKRDLDKVFTVFFSCDQYTPALKSQLHMSYHCLKDLPSTTVLLRTVLCTIARGMVTGGAVVGITYRSHRTHACVHMTRTV